MAELTKTCCGQALNDCGCCQGASPSVPAKIDNRPGLTAIAYRAGTYTQFFESLLTGLSRSEHAVLHGLTTRSQNDYSIALLDAWSVVADVLTFYQERIANELYLRTALERFSLVELSRLIDYLPSPGVAASVYLAFNLENPPGVTRQTSAEFGVPRTTTIDSGLKVQTIPGPNEKPQTFETIETIEARVEWNRIRPRLNRRHPIAADAEKLLFSGLATGLKKSDGLLLKPDDGSAEVFRQIADLILKDKEQVTEVLLQPLGATTITSTVTTTFQYSPQFKYLPGKIAQKYLGQKMGIGNLQAIARTDRFEVIDLLDHLAAITPLPPSVRAFRLRAGIFGHNAPKFTALPVSLRIGENGPNPNSSPPGASTFYPGPYAGRENDWVDTRTLANYPSGNGQNIYLDTTYPGIVKGSRVVLKDGAKVRSYEVEDVAEISKSDFTLSAKITRLTLHTSEGLQNFSIRNTTVFAQDEELTLARMPVAEQTISGTEIRIDNSTPGLFKGQKIIVCGELEGTRGTTECELATIDDVQIDLQPDGFTEITLEKSLENVYVLETVTIQANVALATHGETVEEILGSGNASQPFQKFSLKQIPLTHISADTPDGRLSTLSIRVDDILWREVRSFFERGPEERIYITRISNDGIVTVLFGDGKTGARLPTGQDNVKAIYRKGIGVDGLVKENQITQLLTRPLGLKDVINPLKPTGAEDPEAPADLRRNAPLTVLTLGRIVSLKDYEDFASAFAGIAKALATWIWIGEQRGVLLTVAGSKGEPVEEGSPLFEKLYNGILKAGDPQVPIRIKSYIERSFRINAALKIAPDYLPEKVILSVEEKLREAFSFEARKFGQPVHLSEVVFLMQDIEGVAAVDVKELYRSTETALLNFHLGAHAPLPGDKEITPAELLILDSAPLNLQVMQ